MAASYPRSTRYVRSALEAPYFCHGDGIHDDTQAVLAMIADCQPGDILEFPTVPGASSGTVYLVSQPLVFDGDLNQTGITVRGASAASSQATAGMACVKWNGGTIASGNAAAFTSVSADQWGLQTIVTITGLANLGSVQASDIIIISGATSTDYQGGTPNNGWGTVLTVSTTSVTARFFNRRVGTGSIPIVPDASNGSLQWKIQRTLVKVYSRDILFERLGFHANGSAGSLFDCSNFSNGPCTNIQWRDCALLGGEVGIKAGDYGKLSQQPQNCDLFRMQRVTCADQTDACYVVPNEGGQPKQHVFEQTYFGSAASGLRFHSGSFRVHNSGFGSFTNCAIQPVSPTDIILVESTDFENCTRMLATATGITSTPVQQGAFEVTLTGCRYDADISNLVAPYFLVEYTYGSGLKIAGCEFSIANIGSNNATIALLGSGARTVQATIENTTFSNASNTIVTAYGSNSTCWVANEVVSMSGSTRYEVAQGMHYETSSSNVGMPSIGVGNLSLVATTQVTLTTIGSNDNLANPHVTYLTVAGLGAGATVTGMVAGDPWQLVIWANTSGQTITFVNQLTSQLANQYACPGGVNFALAADKTMLTLYDPGAAKWKILSMA